MAQKIYNQDTNQWLTILRQSSNGKHKVRNLQLNKFEEVDLRTIRFITEQDYQNICSKNASNAQNLQILKELNPSDLTSVEAAYNDISVFNKQFNLLQGEDKDLVMMMQCAVVKPTDNAEIFSIQWNEQYIEMYNSTCDKTNNPHLKLSSSVPMLSTQVELLYNWLNCSIINGEVKYQKVLVTRQGTPLNKVQVVEKEVEVIKKVIETKIIKQEVKSGIDQDKIKKLADKFIKTYTRTMNSVSASTAEEAIREFVKTIK